MRIYRNKETYFKQSTGLSENKTIRIQAINYNEIPEEKIQQQVENKKAARKPCSFFAILILFFCLEELNARIFDIGVSFNGFVHGVVNTAGTRR